MSTGVIAHSEQLAIVAEANLAPSVHNTQPTRWRFVNDAIELYADPSRFLGVGDPEHRDASLSCGAAVEGTVMSLASRNLGVTQVDGLWSQHQTSDGLRLAARIGLGGTSVRDALEPQVHQRYTWRGDFKAIHDAARNALTAWTKTCAFATVTLDTADIAWIADLNDATSLSFISDKAYRDELVGWMRFSRSDERWGSDGLNAAAMQMSGVESFGARIVLSSPVFEVAHALKLTPALVSENSKTCSASAVVFFHVPADTPPLDVGRKFYRLWLELTQCGLVAWPMAVLADNESSNAQCRERFGFPEDSRLVNVFRVGFVPDQGIRQTSARLDPAELIIS